MIRRIRKLYSSNKISQLLHDLQNRNLIHSSTNEPPLDNLSSITAYTGFDPTAKSLHVGNLIALTTLSRFKMHGCDVIALIGGATGQIGDPSGKSTERLVIGIDIIKENSKKISEQITRILDRSTGGSVKVLDNFEWYKGMGLLEFMSVVGKFVRIGDMLTRDSVRNRLSPSSHGLSFTEFSYQLFQAYDFYYLNKNFGCNLQVGGSDQWGNIVAGIDLIRRKSNEKSNIASGLVYPLLTTKNGVKFGKSEGNAVWLDNELTSYFDFYQFFMRTEDVEVEKLLKFLTFLPVEEIDVIMNEHFKDPSLHLAQQKLAENVTLLVHGDEGLRAAETASSVLYGGSLQNISADDIIKAVGNDRKFMLKDNVISEARTLLDFCWSRLNNVFKSKNELRRLMKQGGLNVNNVKVTDPNQTITDENFIEGKLLLFRVGKADYYLIVKE